MCWVALDHYDANPERLPTSRRQCCFAFRETMKCCADWPRSPTIKSAISLLGAADTVQSCMASTNDQHGH
jgi:hypothetical protein